MRVRERILSIRLLDKMKRNPKIAEEINESARTEGEKKSNFIDMVFKRGGADYESE